MKNSNSITEDILKKTKRFLDKGYKQILIINDNVYASAGLKLPITKQDIENAAVLPAIQKNKIKK